jgi:HD-GYP domain-containing protein (c-di-GMP phosphodiesterase class II)
MDTVNMGFLRRLGIRYEPVDAGGRIIPRDPGFWEMALMDFPPGPVGVCESFDEAMGAEDLVIGALREGTEGFHLAGFRRGERYLNLSVFPDVDDDMLERVPGARGVVVLEDVTGMMRAQQEAVQSKNEISMLGTLLQKSNAEYRNANIRLDMLMNEIRTHNHDLDLQVKYRTRELHMSRLSAITTLARVAEYRDTDTGGHINRLGRTSVLIGKRHGLPTATCEQLFYSSLLHDVGKIGIPDSILLKPGKLTAEEWIVMRSHTRIGSELLSRSDHLLFDSARDVALHHHERWDGSGYPDGLAGEAIPLPSRICAIADVFDALTSKRPYKSSWSVEMAVETMRAESETAFDPDLLASFFDVIDDIVALKAEAEELEYLPSELG